MKLSWGAADYSLALAGNHHLHNAARAAFRVAAPLCFGSAMALADSINLSEMTADTTVADGETLTGTLGAYVKITIADGATVTLDGVGYGATGAASVFLARCGIYGIITHTT